MSASSNIPTSPVAESARQGEIISRWMAEEHFMLPGDTTEIVDFERRDNPMRVMRCYRRTDGSLRRIDDHQAWNPSEEFKLARTVKIVDTEKPTHEQVFTVLTDRLLSAFLAYRYDIDVRPEELYSIHDKDAIKQQIKWNLRHFIEPLLVGRSQSDGPQTPTEANI